MDRVDRHEARERRLQQRLVEKEARRQKIHEARNAVRKQRSTARKMKVAERITAGESARRDVLSPIEEGSGLPRALLIGDSISIGYTVAVQKLLEGKANVQRIPRSGGSTSFGLAHMSAWLGYGRWDVIHFNFGLEDAMQISPGAFCLSREHYAENLRQLVAEMKTTGARLIFATTMPALPGDVLSSVNGTFDDIPARNELARRIMDEHGVAIDDLYAVARPWLEDTASAPGLDLAPDRYELLARAVAASIEAHLPLQSKVLGQAARA
jgi:lysophospholipase L1-like esterase